MAAYYYGRSKLSKPYIFDTKLIRIKLLKKQKVNVPMQRKFQFTRQVKKFPSFEGKITLKRN